MTRPFDAQYASLILGILTRPFSLTKAYSYGIINDDGILVKKPTTAIEKEAYTPLHQLVFGVKRVLDSLPGSAAKIQHLAVAMNYIRNQYVPEQFKESVDLNQFLKELQLVIENNLVLIEEEVLIESLLKEDGETAPVDSQPTTTDAIDIHTPVIKKLFAKDDDEEK